MFRHFRRCYSTINKYRRQNDYQEIQIPFEWGSVRGKLWGEPNKRPVVALHGWQDSSGTFDTLVPLLQNEVSFLALDLPGHGRSSHYPRGVGAGEGMSYMILIRRLQKMFGWEKISFMSHSLGAIVSFFYASHYPDNVDYLICFDGLVTYIPKNSIEQTSKSMDELLRYEELLDRSTKPPVYTMEELIQLLHVGSDNSIDLDKCKYILERNILPYEKEPGKFYFTRDVRLKAGPLNWLPFEELLGMAKRITMPILLLKATDGSVIDKGGWKGRFEMLWEEVAKSSPDARMYVVEGKHHVHLNNPERVADKVNEFLGKYYVHEYLPLQLQGIQAAQKCS